ncbi:MAG: rubrerythrin [Myxococcota bacterium]|jgi:rubrerythrin
MRSLADKRVFPSPEAARQSVEGKDAVAALELALAFELASVTFFEGLREGLDGADRAVIDELVEEEREHAERI